MKALKTICVAFALILATFCPVSAVPFPDWDTSILTFTSHLNNTTDAMIIAVTVQVPRGQGAWVYVWIDSTLVSVDYLSAAGTVGHLFESIPHTTGWCVEAIVYSGWPGALVEKADVIENVMHP